MTYNTTTKVLILGSTGRLGSKLRAAWALNPPASLDLVFQSRNPPSGAGLIRWSPGEATTPLPACDAVVALWGQTSGEFSDPDLNVTLADHSRAVALVCGARYVVHLSSAAVYGPAEDATETSVTAPINPYGHSKLAMEAHVAQFDDPRVQHTCLRLANVVGADSLAPALSGTGDVTLDQFADGAGPLRSYIGAGDLAQVLAELCRGSGVARPATLNIAAHSPVAMADLTRAAGKEIKWRDAPPHAVQTVTMKTTALARLLPQITPEADATRLIRQWRAQEAFSNL